MLEMEESFVLFFKKQNNNSYARCGNIYICEKPRATSENHENQFSIHTPKEFSAIKKQENKL